MAALASRIKQLEYDKSFGFRTFFSSEDPLEMGRKTKIQIKK